ncbi:50S ribosomal protein L9 [Portibacter lacus]|uniref:Large ribosomal subunit protein bL9 n=1 Tax=Portibacter lacus TaxID=1099794 RepID=A0AA37SPT7_9BACT|nr:50S ribosomal protein L9 [Portibacter lacus]GLR18556.1 50S ribosomal protein L9 [Portibacter lacus]
MNIILLTDIDNLGDKHSIVTVKNGYGRNYLIPRGLGLIANAQNKGKLNDIIAKEEAERAARLSEFQEIAQKLKDVTLTIPAKSGTSGKIFGSVTNLQIANKLKEEQDVDVERRRIVLPEDIKTLGKYTAVLNLHPQVDAKVDFEVVKAD